MLKRYLRRLVLFLMLSCGCCTTFAQHEFIDSVERLLDSIQIDRHRAQLLLQLTGAYRNVNPYKGLDYAGSGLQIARTIGDRMLEAKIINEMGVLYRKADMYEQALEMHHKALTMFEKMDEHMGIAFALANIGNVYFALEQYNKALDYNKQSLSIKRGMEDPEQLAYSLRTTALAYQALGAFREAEELLVEALAITSKLNDDYGLGNLYYHLGNVAFASDTDKNRALDYYQHALGIYNNLQSHYGTAISSYQKALAHLEMDQDSLGYESLKAALDISQRNGMRKITMDVFAVLSDWYKNNGDFEEALDFYTRHALLRDSLFTETTNRNIAEMQAKYDLNRQQAQIELLEKEKKLNTVSQLFYILAIIFISSFGVLVLLRYRDKKKINEKLEQEIEQRKTQEQKLLNSEQRLKTANATKDKFFSIISHDLKSPFGAIMGLSELLDEDADQYSEKDKKRLISEIRRATTSTYSLLQDLLTWSQSQRGIMEYKPRVTSLADICHESLDFIKTAADRKGVGLTCHVPDKISVVADRNMITTVIRNLLSNAVKFTPRGGNISIAAQAINQGNLPPMIEIKVRDNGVGISDDNLSKLFRIEEKFKTFGTEHETGTGLGLIICREFIEKHGGTISAMSRVGHGSTFCFTLPAEANF